MRMNRFVRFGFGGLTVLVARRGDPLSFNTTAGGAYSALLSPDLLKPEIKQELIRRGAVHCTTTEYLLMRSNALQDLGTSMQLLQQVHWVTVVA